MVVVLVLLTGGLGGGLVPPPAAAQERPPADDPEPTLRERAPADSAEPTPRTRAPIDSAEPAPVESLPTEEVLPREPGEKRNAPDRATASADTLDQPGPSAVPDTGIVARYLPKAPRRRGPFDAPSPLFGPRSPTPSPKALTLDPDTLQYTLTDDPYADGPMQVDRKAYQRDRYRANLRDNWASLTEQRRQRQGGRGGVGVSLTVPGGGESAFTTIFGKPQVDLRLNGQADINAGFEYSKNDRQGARTGDPTQLDPSFKQDLRLGITGTIGDKLKINVDWDTNSQFDYQNQIKLEYDGYDDEIIQSIEAGNVFLETPSSLIQGGQSLFGIKGRFQLGNLTLTTIASQQEGQSNSLSIEGGAETSEFTLKPTDYDDATHFFLGYYFRNNWNRAHESPTSITLFNGFNQITDIEVWKLQTSTNTSASSADVRDVAALVDLGESSRILEEANEYTNPEQLMRPSADQHTEENLQNLREGTQPVSSYADSSALTRPLQAQDWEDGDFKRLERGRDYRLDSRLGFVSLKQRLRPSEALAVAFRYRANGQTYEVGDFSSEQSSSTGGVESNQLVLKLLRPQNPVAPGSDTAAVEERPPAWFLEMRNIYRLSGRNLNADNFNLDIEYNPSGQGVSTTVPEISTDPLLQVLGLDRVDQSGAPTADNEFDFTAQTINTEQGLIYFPYLQPFGQRILDVAGNSGAPLAFRNLYFKKKDNAETEDTGKNVYQLTGSYKGQAKGFYDLKAFTGLVDGSVNVTSGGQTLTEGEDYVVDYQSGTVNITNRSYLASGREINISYEQQSVSSLQQKTLLGARADWSLRDKFELGATAMRLSEQSPVDKYRVGQEPIKNTIWGVDGAMNLEPQWLTELVDALPLVQTRAESRISVESEFAQLRPGHTTTEAYEETVEEVENSSKDSYASDERNGISYIDDFEGFENTFSLREQPGAWDVSAAPDSVPAGGNARERTWWRGSFGWYQLNDQIKDDLRGRVDPPSNPGATALIDVQDVFVGRDTRGSGDNTLRTLDMYFNPWKRGPYNYLDSGDNLVDFFQNPKQVWGGVTRQLPEGYTDFSVQNVEFVEFIVKPYPHGGGRPTEGSKLYVNLGTVSEDVVPNRLLNTEDGLSLSYDEDDIGSLSRIAGSSQDGAVDVRGNITEDLGLDGLVSYAGPNSSYDDRLREATQYADFIEYADTLSVNDKNLTADQRARLKAEIKRIQNDPSADDYHHYENDRYFDNGDFFVEEDEGDGSVTLQERFSRYYAGDELNSFEGQNQLARDVSIRRGISGDPDTEDLDRTGGSANITNNYYRYEIPLDKLEERAGVDAGSTDYVVDKVGRREDWYKIRIPVEAFGDKVGTPQSGFTRIESIRMWTTGHDAPITMRFASLELVGSQWRKSQTIAKESTESDSVSQYEGKGTLRVASINNEEDPDYEAPVGAVVSQSRTATGVQQRNREQALLLNVNNLEPGQQRGVSKTFQQGLDLLKYSNLRMYTHLSGTPDSLKKNLRLFVRLGGNESEDYYEYEQPLTPTGNGMDATSAIWPEDSEMNLVLSRLSELKTARDESGARRDTVFTSGTNFPLDFAPEGTRLKIRGTPSLNDLTTVVIGVRHVGGMGDQTVRNAEVWVNELRVSGFDEQSGWATKTNASIELANLASIQGNFRRQTDGFGSLSSTLDERNQVGRTAWNLNTEFNVDALLPKQQGWDIPLTMQLSSSLREPRFDQKRGDVRVTEVQRQFDRLDAETIREQFQDRYPGQSAGEIRDALQDSVKRASETRNFDQSYTASVSKNNSQSWWLRNTVDATSLNFRYSDQRGRSPQRTVNDQWTWNGDLQYQLDFGKARTVQPLGFLPDAPVLSTLGGVSFNYVPTSLSFGAQARRQAGTQRNRPSIRENTNLPPRILNRFEDSHSFTHRRNFGLQYDPFEFLSLSFDTNTQQNLNEVSTRTQQNVIFGDSLDVGRGSLTDVDTSEVFDNPERFGLEGVSGDSLRRSVGETVFVEERIRTKSEQEVFQDLFFGSASPRTESYGQRLSATLQIGLLDRKALNWISVQDVSYQSSFQWNNGGKGSLTGASVNNSASLRTGVSLHPNKVWERFGFYERMKKAQRDDQREDQEGDDERPEGRQPEGRQPGGQQPGGEQPGGRQPEGRKPGGQQPGDQQPDGQQPDDDATDGEADESGTEGDDSTGEDAENGPGWDDIPLPDPVGVLRRVALTFMDVRDLTVSYNGERSARSSNVGDLQTGPGGTPTGVSTDYSLLDAIQGQGPPLGYRLGLDRQIALEDRVFASGQVVDNFTNSHRFEARTSLTPSSAFNIDLNWTVNWTTQPKVDIQRTPDRRDPFRRIETESGNAQASAWVFGSYQSFFEKQLATFRRNSRSQSSPQGATETALTKASVAQDFREAYLLGGGSSIGGNGFAPFPMPGWTVRYSGLSDWPLIKRVTESVSLNHSYSGSYKTGFNSISTAGDTTTVSAAGTSFNYVEAPFEPQSVQIQKDFQPMIGVDVTWPFGLQTSVEWNRRTTVALRGTNVVERKTGEISGRLSYSKRGMNLPFFERIDNRIQVSLTLTRSVNDEREFLLSEALQQAQESSGGFDSQQALRGDNVNPLSQTTMLEIAPEISYSVSNRVTAKFLLEYEKFDGDNRRPSYTNINGSFNLSVSISQN